ncbi:MAG: ATP-binding cassette domain-containing protein [Candidatus Marinimicrobia bacterium]|jgi:ABC-2 type transport system ATP-binding protein|nr:ATP-binding cassette domain-containing protein [Candidatus Neomarinimicrobiota bacterium]
MIHVENLSKNYGNIKAVKSINFDIGDGEIVGFLGPNGAGKSTTIKVLTGFLAPTSGSVSINGMNILENELEIQKCIGYLPELNPLYTEMIVYDYLQFIASVRNIKGKQFSQALGRVIEQCGLKGILHRHIGNCSKGYKQRIGLAASMIHDPKILVLDEPVSGLDPNQIVEIRELIKGLGREKLVLMSSHILQEIQATVDRIIILNNGKIVADGTSENLISDSKAKTTLNMEIVNATKESVEEMKAVVPSVNLVEFSDEGESSKVQLEYPPENDPRKDIFSYGVEKGWVILEMATTKSNLEDIFRNLTVTEVADA